MNGLRKALAAALSALLVVTFAPASALSAVDAAEANFSENAAPAEETEADSFDSDAALLKYLGAAKTVPSGRGPRRALLRTQRSRLTANEKVIYDKALNHFKAIVDGTSKDGSTPIKIAYKEFPNTATKYSFTELGITLTSDEKENKNAIMAALEKKFPFEPLRIVSALTADYPEYFFWYGRTVGTSYAWSQGSDFIDVTNSSLTFTINAAASYAVDAGNNQYYPEKIDTDKIRAIDKARKNVASIVAEAKGLDDYEKLEYYVKKISDLNTYDHNAAAASTSNPDYPHSYNDPWEIINVFDEDSNTNVVCEGYAKSFKFLVDNSDFTNTVSAYTVSGTVSQPNSTSDNGVSSGPHMWNLIRINGTSYHVDPTFCDCDTAGGCSMIEFLAATEATGTGYKCTWPDYTVGKYSFSGSYAIYEFDAGTKSIYTPDELAVSREAYVHTVTVTGVSLNKNTLSLFGGASETLTATVSPDNKATDKTVTWSSSNPSVATVDENGKVIGVSTGKATITATSNADKSKSASCTVTVTVPVIGLTLSSTSITVAVSGEVQLTAEISPKNATDPSVTWASSDPSAVTVTDGKVKGIKADSTATITATSNADSSIKATCQVKVGSYTFGDWKDNKDGKTHTHTANENASVTETAEHTWDKGRITTAATCGAAGKMLYTCEVCSATKEETIPATGNHSWNEGTITTPATCKDKGVKTYTCSICRKTRTESIPKIDTHAFTEDWYKSITPTCTTAGQEARKCSVCGKMETRPLAALGHDYGKWKDNKDGKTHTRTCSRDASHVETAKHNWNEGVVDLAATCGAAGKTTYTCTDCGATATVEVPATGEHTWDSGTVTMPATCQADGVMTYKCSVCGQTKTEPIPKASAHDWGDWTTTKEPTCTEPGVKSHKCSLCDTVETQPIEALGHSYGKWTDTGDGNTHIRKCSRDENHTETANHAFGAWKVTKPATAKETGLREHTCTACGAVVTETIPVTTSGGSAGGSGSSTGGSGSTGGTGTTGGSSSGSSTGGSGSSSATGTTSGSVVPAAGSSSITVTAPANASPQENAAAAAITAATTPSASTENTPTSLVTGSGWQESVSEAARAAEKNADVRAFISEHSGETVTVTAVPRIEIAVVSAATSSITYEITPKYDVVVTAGSASRTVAINAEVPVTTVVTVNIPVPESFAADGTVLYVVHKLDNGNVRYYRGTVKGGVLSFLNPDGFSEFTLSTAMPAGFVDSSLKTVYRLFNRNNGEHLFTTDEAEKTNCIKNGWSLEGEACRVAATSDTPVYRLINPSIGMHMYTTGTDEMEALKKCGWRYEGVAFYSSGAVPVYRVFDKHSNNCNHLFTTGEAERDALLARDWNNEGIGWYAFE